MYDSLIKRLANNYGPSLLGVFFGQYLIVVLGPALIILGFGIWNPFIVLAGLLSLRLLPLLTHLQQDIIQQIIDNERRNHFFGTRQKRKKST